MTFLTFRVISLLVFIYDCHGAISDKRLCGDPTCSEPVSLGLTLIRYVSDDARILSFQGNVKAKVFSKSAGSRPDLWGVEIDGKRGYAPKSFIKEQKILRGQLDHVISTNEETSDEGSQTPTPSHTIIGNIDRHDDEDVAKTKEEQVEDLKGELLSPLNIEASANGVEKALPPSEMREPYEVVDGTTLMFSPDSSTEPSPIQATTTKSDVLPSAVQFQSNTESTTQALDNPTPNPSLALPNAATSADANGEKQDTEGSAEKIYNYLMSNFMSEEGDGEVTSDETEEIVKKEGVALTEESNNKAGEVFLKPTESSPESSGRVLDQIQISTPPTSMDIDATSRVEKVEELVTLMPSQSEAVKKEEGNDVGPQVAGENNLDENSDEVASDEDEDEEEDEDEDLEEEDTDISEEDENDEEWKTSNELVETETDSTHSHVDLVDSTKIEQITKNPNDINDTNIEYLATKINERSDEKANSFVSDGPVSSINATPEASEPRAEDLVSNLNAQAADLPSLGMNEPTSDQMTDLKSFNIRAEMETKVDSITTESIVDQHLTHIPSNLNLNPIDDSSTKTSTINLEQNLAGRMVLKITEDRDILFEKSNLDKNDDTNEINPSDKPQDLQETGSDMGNIVDEITESSKGENVSYKINDVEQDRDQIRVSVEPQLESALNFTSQEPYISLTEGADNVADIIDDDLVTKPPTDESTGDFYVDNLREDSSLNIVTETLSTTPEPVVDSIPENNVESSVGFFSGIVSSLFSSSFSGSEMSSPTESVVAETDEKENKGSVEKSEDISMAQRFLLSSGKQPDMLDASSTCSAQSGNNPGCDNVLFAGSDSRRSDDEAAILETMESQEEQVPSVEMWESGKAFGMISYLAITAISMVVIILGHWFIEKTRCDSSFIKRINDLERALLYAELESQNLKVDLEETKSKVLNSEDDDIMKAIQEQLQAALDANTSLEEKNASLQESLDAATEAGLELNRMLSDILSTNKGSESLMLSVNDLQLQLNSQQTTINNMNSVLSVKEVESEGLRHNLSTAHDTIHSLERELKQLTESLNERLQEKKTQEERSKSTKIDLENQLKIKSSREEELAEEVGALQLKIRAMESDQNTRDIEMELLRDCVKQLKEESSGDNEDYKQLFDVAKAKATCLELQAERDRLADELQGEKDARKLLADHVDVTTKEVESLWNTLDQCEKEKQEALTKYAVLADYFKDKESQLHKELGYKDAMYMQSQGEATSTHEVIRSLQEQVDSYKSQIDTLKSEIVDQERGLKSQILAFEKKAYDNWLAGRQADRQLQEAKIEASLLRNRLTIVEKNASNAGHNDVSVVERDSMGLNCVSPASPQLYPLDTNVPAGDNPTLSATRLPMPPPPLALINHPLDETHVHSRSNHASPSLGTRLQPVVHKSPANFDVQLRGKEPYVLQSPFRDFIGPPIPHDLFHGTTAQERRNPEHYSRYPVMPYGTEPAPLILPPPVPSSIPGTRDRRPPPLGRMSSPPIGAQISPPPPRGHKTSPVHGRVASLYNHASPPPQERRRRRSSPLSDRILSPPPFSNDRSPSPERGRRRSLQRRRGTPTRRHTSRSVERERRRSVDSTSQNHVSPSHGRTPSPGQGRSYRRRSRSPSPYSSAGSTPESRRRHTRRFDFSPDGSYRSRTSSPSGFRPISRHANQGSNHSYESDESNRRGGRP